MGLRDQLKTLMWQHGVEQETLLDALDWKFKKIADERDRLREALVAVVREWDNAPDPVFQQLKNLWLVESMTPAIDAARAELAKKAG